MMALNPASQMIEAARLRDLFSVTGIEHHIKKGSILHMQNDPATEFYYVKCGIIRSYVISQSGAELTLEMIGAGNLFGESSYFTNSPRLTSAIAMSDLTLRILDYDDIAPLIREEPLLAAQLMGLMGQKVQLLTTLAQNMAFLSADKKIAYILVQMKTAARECKGQSHAYVLDYTHQEIGDLVGVGRITVSRTLRQFEDRGWVSLYYHSVTVLEDDRLFEYAVF